MRKLFALLTILLFSIHAQATDVNQTFYKLRDKILSVKDYTADIRMKINVSFMRIPDLRGRIYFKSPDKLRLERFGGISILPKKNINITLNNLLPAGNATVIDAGYDMLEGKKIHVLKIVPSDEQTDIVLTKMWVDEVNLLALRVETTTKDEGTVQMDLHYGNYENYALPDKAIIYIDVKEYKLPKGVTMDYTETDNNASKPKIDGKTKQKGRIEITYLSYKINTGLSDAVFNKK